MNLLFLYCVIAMIFMCLLLSCQSVVSLPFISLLPEFLKTEKTLIHNLMRTVQTADGVNEYRNYHNTALDYLLSEVPFNSLKGRINCLLKSLNAVNGQCD